MVEDVSASNTAAIKVKFKSEVGYQASPFTSFVLVELIHNMFQQLKQLTLTLECEKSIINDNEGLRH